MSCSRATPSTSRWWSASRQKALRTHRNARRRLRRSTGATRRRPSCCGRHGSKTSGRSRVEARRCHRRARTSIRSSPRACCSIRLTDWLALCREAVVDVRHVLAELPTRADREPVVGSGMGGDETTAIDAAAERVVLARFDGVEDLTVVSEEIGTVGDGRTYVVVDPIDGSLNAKRGIGFFSLSVAIASGPTMGDVEFGFVHGFGRGGEWPAARGGRAFTRGRSGNAGAMPPTGARSIRIGCSGWNYQAWKDEFYEGKPARLWLQHYAQHFDTVEVNNTFYRLPLKSSVASWVAQTP